MVGWILTSSDPEMTVRLAPGTMKTLGRSARAEFIVEAALVSRLHCRLTVDDADALSVQDLESTNGIFVNGQKAEAAALNAGDILSVGRVDFAVART